MIKNNRGYFWHPIWDELKFTTGIENWDGGGGRGGNILSTVCMDLYNYSITVSVTLYKHSGSPNGKSMQCCTVTITVVPEVVQVGKSCASHAVSLQSLVGPQDIDSLW